MTKDDIIRMAALAGWEMDDSCVLEPQVVWYISQGQLESFAALVAAAEREACAALCDRGDPMFKPALTQFDCADLIRARGQQ